MAPKLKQLFYHNKQTAGGGRVGLSLKTAPPPFEECPSASARESETSYVRCTLSTPRGSWQENAGHRGLAPAVGRSDIPPNQQLPNGPAGWRTCWHLSVYTTLRQGAGGVLCM